MAKSRTRQTILAFITAFRAAKGYAPTVKEIADNCAVTSLSVVQYHLGRLEKEGAIRRERNKSRSINPIAELPQPAEVPVLGVIAAGHPIGVPDADTISAADRRIQVPDFIIRGKHDVFALEVRGNSMVDAMIADGDFVVMYQTQNIKNGDVVAVWLKSEQEVTLKKIYFEGPQVRLQPCNPFMMPIYQSADNVEVQGKVVGVIRGTG